MILHGLFEPSTINWLYKNKHILEKCYWFIWGGDLYDAAETRESAYVKKNVKAYLGGLQWDAEFARKKYGSNAPFLPIDIPSPLTLEMLENARIDKSGRDYTTIQIEHRANKTILETMRSLTA